MRGSRSLACHPEAALDIRPDTSPEVAIKQAYDFAWSLRINGANEHDFQILMAQWTKRFGTSPLVPYIRGGFSAGFHFEPLPWKRAIENHPILQS